MSPEEAMRQRLDEVRVSHEDDAIRQTLFAFVAYGEKVETYFNWLMAAMALALVFSQWGSVPSASLRLWQSSRTAAAPVNQSSLVSLTLVTRLPI